MLGGVIEDLARRVEPSGAHVEDVVSRPRSWVPRALDVVRLVTTATPEHRARVAWCGRDGWDPNDWDPKHS